ncbi:MAG: type I-F CRISPR-associated protein Csy3 [Candidatus Thiodiazotropha sp. (ex Lucinoma kastoroae)]|nr:type I-F CRISPR-associated protein Csy3 [Candidatus Thiodiazotropha sp. (ex Lucinoma kastoroae)]
MADLKTASVLAFERKLDPSDALFSAGRWDDQDNGDKWQPVTVSEKSVRGTISNRLKTKDQDPAKLDATIQSPNLQTVDVAMLPNDTDTLRVRFTLKLLGGVGQPSACNNTEYQQQLKRTVDGYIEQVGFSELAKRYAGNIANARFLWRNRLGSEQIVVQIHVIKEGKRERSWSFDALKFSLRNFEPPSDHAQDFSSLVSTIKKGLANETYVLLEVIAYARVGDGQEVYPSQELILDRGDSKRGQKSKTLYSVNEVAGIHSQKIGNALRTIDTWYEDIDGIGPIAVEPYGSVTTHGKAYRQPKQKIDFYNLLDNWVLKGKEPDEGNQHYVMATLVRGGVFGSSEKD